jgi:hypothetical protein
MLILDRYSVIVAKDGKQKTLKLSNLFVRNVVVNFKKGIVSPILIFMMASEP